MQRSRSHLFIIFILCCFSEGIFGQEKKEYNITAVAFYNLENLFDIYDDPKTFDDDRTPQGKDRWTEAKYRDKLKNMAYAISRIGFSETNAPPAIIGVCEIENLQVLEDLVAEPALEPFNYGIIHYDSPDLRGIDVALLYRKQLFMPEHSVSHELILYDPEEPDKRVYTRDQLVVAGLLQGERVHVIVNHWPSRSGGEKASSPKREKAALLNRQIVDSLFRTDPYARIISVGDFNDDPHNKSLKKVLGAKSEKKEVGFKELYNPMAALAKKGIGSLAYRDGWNLFDQIIVSSPFLDSDYSRFTFYKAGIFNEQFLVTPSGQYKGYPFRSFGDGGFTGGYSDHFPVYVLLIKEKP
ncbi:Endonuclease/Exonuclease/phosphatase family protein [Salinimicrobium catena]|uniref:Endonuclease/Exonuclease/phosphatase family protein n=1 Tax=Salinimicrobium catena TaxID=390640 RepID=A0A1H5J6X2_9FLAO|nr:endonuclease/exonuclease/phosphatase family protein [Salinimicrobium catena]SDK84860.1 Endonuclease/Exonuclease/phosphatase family protein [Salinimicrobium catena]SEE48232.1 Endonuclease/Exonuclease/phosphatase family protein [Salinimicrobium catena]